MTLKEEAQRKAIENIKNWMAYCLGTDEASDMWLENVIEPYADVLGLSEAVVEDEDLLEQLEAELDRQAFPLALLTWWLSIVRWGDEEKV